MRFGSISATRTVPLRRHVVRLVLCPVRVQHPARAVCAPRRERTARGIAVRAACAHEGAGATHCSGTAGSRSIRSRTSRGPRARRGGAPPPYETARERGPHDGPWNRAAVACEAREAARTRARSRTTGCRRPRASGCDGAASAARAGVHCATLPKRTLPFSPRRPRATSQRAARRRRVSPRSQRAATAGGALQHW